MDKDIVMRKILLLICFVMLAPVCAFAQSNCTVGSFLIGCNYPAAVVASATFTRPSNTTAYAIGQLVANSTTAGSVTPMALSVARINGLTGQMRRFRLEKSGTTTTSAAFIVYFFSQPPVPTVGDGTAFATSGNAYYMGSVTDRAGRSADAGINW